MSTSNKSPIVKNNTDGKIIQIQDINKEIEDPVFFINLNSLDYISIKYYKYVKNVQTDKWETEKLEYPIVMLYKHGGYHIDISYENFLKYVAHFIEHHLNKSING